MNQAARRKYARDQRQFNCYQSDIAKGELRSADQFRANLLPREFTTGDRRQQCVSIPHTERKFLATLLGGAAACPLAASAQQPAVPVIGFLAEGTPDSEPGALMAFHQGLREAGYVEGQNVQIDYRWTGNQRDLLLALTADLIRRDVTVI
jgi:hypothetical protein